MSVWKRKRGGVQRRAAGGGTTRRVFRSGGLASWLTEGLSAVGQTRCTGEQENFFADPTAVCGVVRTGSQWWVFGEPLCTSMSKCQCRETQHNKTAERTYAHAHTHTHKPQRPKSLLFVALALRARHRSRRAPSPETNEGFLDGKACPAGARTPGGPIARGAAAQGRSRPGGWSLPQRPRASPAGSRQVPSAAVKFEGQVGMNRHSKKVSVEKV